jgi:hypothetical protein
MAREQVVRVPGWVLVVAARVFSGREGWSAEAM